MKLLLTLTTLLATATFLNAADETSGVSFIDHDKVAVALSKAGPLVGLEGTGTYNVHISRRVKPGPAEAHVKDTDFFYILDGSATVIAGGTMVGGKETRPGLIVGSDIRGGKTYHLSKGTVMVIPAGIPHWFKEVPKSIDYYVVQAAVEQSRAK
jgi:mannose-6-phosphate isomerase-like protein (cupin superfamily)